MPYAKNRTRDKKTDSVDGDPTALKEPVVLTKTARVADFGDEEEALIEGSDGAAVENADGDESALSEDEELDAADLNPFGDKWEE